MMVAIIQASALALKRPCYRITSTTVTTPREVTSQAGKEKAPHVGHDTTPYRHSPEQRDQPYPGISASISPPFLALLEYGGGTQVTIKVAIDR